MRCRRLKRTPLERRSRRATDFIDTTVLKQVEKEDFFAWAKFKFANKRRWSKMKLRVGNGCWHAGHVQAAMNALEAGFFSQEGLDVEVVHAKISKRDGVEPARWRAL